MSAGDSAAAHAARVRAEARKGLWRRIQAWLGVGKAIRRADAVAARWEIGAVGEEQTGRLLAHLEPAGWHVRHDLALPGSRANLDTLLVAPSGAVVVVDTKTWRRSWPTRLVGGRVVCGLEDRHGQIEAVGRYAAKVATVLCLPADQVWPLVVVHGSTVDGGALTVRVAAWPGPLYVLGTGWLVPTLDAAGRRWAADPVRARAVADRVDQVLPPYVDGSRQ